MFPRKKEGACDEEKKWIKPETKIQRSMSNEYIYQRVENWRMEQCSVQQA